jgi:hypothetical protein
MPPTAAIDRLPIDVPTDFILGTAGLGSVLMFGVGLVTMLRAQRRVDPLPAAGWGAGVGGLVAASLWLGSVVGEVLFR